MSHCRVSQFGRRILWIVGFEVWKHLREPDRYIGCFGQGKLLAETNSWSTAKRHVGPSYISKVFPSFRSIDIRIFAIVGFQSVHTIRSVENELSLGNKYRRLLVFTTTPRQGGIFFSNSKVLGHRRIHSQSFIYDPLQVRAFFHRFECNLFKFDIISVSKVLINLTLQFTPNFRIPCQLKEKEWEKACGSISTG